MLTIQRGLESPDLVMAVQRFRGRIYLAEGAIAELVDGRHIETSDRDAYHLVVTHDGKIRASLRYQQLGRGIARVGGWAVDPGARGSAAGLSLITEAVALAERLGDCYATATATTRHNSSAILRRMGGRSLLRYYDPAYRCEMELLEFHLADFRAAALPRAA